MIIEIYDLSLKVGYVYTEDTIQIQYSVMCVEDNLATLSDWLMSDLRVLMRQFYRRTFSK